MPKQTPFFFSGLIFMTFRLRHAGCFDAPTYDKKCRRREEAIVSLLWRDQVRIGVAPDRLIVAGYQRGVNPRLVRKDIIEVQPQDAAPGWQAAIDALPEALAPSRARKPEVSIVLSNCLVRYALVPWDSTLRTEADWLAIARHRLVAVHGPAAEHWELRVTETVRMGALIACGVEVALLDAVQARVAEARAILHSVQPYLIAAFNRIRNKIGLDTCWLVIEEPGCLMLALIRAGHWMSIRFRHVDANWRAAFQEILERESSLLALEEPCTRVVLYTPFGFEADACGGYQLRDLTLAGGTAPEYQPLAMALA